MKRLFYIIIGISLILLGIYTINIIDLGSYGVIISILGAYVLFKNKEPKDDKKT